MARTYSQLKADTLAILQDASTVNFGSVEMDTFLMQACRERSLPPYVTKVSFNIESRRGVATSTSSGNLVDATAVQFLSTDVGKVVFNTFDKTWAVITSYTSTSQVALSKDIMAVNEGYYIYNSGCTQNDQIDISSIDDYLEVERMEYPVGTARNWELNGTVLTIKVDVVQNSQIISGNAMPDTEVMVWFKKRHLVSQLTDLSATVAGTAAIAGATTLAMSSLQAAGTIEAGQELTISLTRGTYTVTSDATISSNTVSVAIYPPLESAVAATTAVTLKGSTLTPTLEPLVAELAAGLAAVSKPIDLYQHSFDAVTAVGLGTTAMTTVAGLINAATLDASSARNALTSGITTIASMTAYINAATANVTSGTVYTAAGTTFLASATTEIAKIVTEVQLAASALASGTSLINTIPVGGGVGEWMGQASGDIGVAQGRMVNGQAWLQQASAELNQANSYYTIANLNLREAGEVAQQVGLYHTNASQYLNSAASELRMASERIEESNANMRKAATELQIVASGRNLESWGRNQLAETRLKLSRLMPTKYMTSRTLPKD
jgi:hypothetical protein